MRHHALRPRPGPFLLASLVVAGGLGLAPAALGQRRVVVAIDGKPATYELVAPLNEHYDGRNGLYSITYRARRIDGGERGRVAAIKLLRDSARAQGWGDTFNKELRVLQRLEGKHPTIPIVFGIGMTVGERPERALVMELVEGGPIPTNLRTDDALRLTTQLAGGVAALHREGLEHRDLHFGNLLVKEDLRPGSLRLLDYGATALLGTPYDGPSVTARNGDVMQLGRMYLQMTGAPAVRDGLAQALEHVEDRRTIVEGRSLSLRDVIGRTMNANRALRHPTAIELERELKLFLKE